MEIAIIGAGRIGSAIGFQLCREGGHDVTMIARDSSERLEQLKRDEDAIVTAQGGKASVKISSSLDLSLSYDLVIVTVLAHQVTLILGSLEKCKANHILFMFNNFQPELLAKKIGSDRCVLGMPFLQSDFNGEGHLQMQIGAMGQKSYIDDRQLVDMFNRSGLPAVFEPDMMSWLRCHAPMCVAFESISVCGVRSGHGASWTEAMTVARGTLAGFSLIESLGYPIYPTSKRFIASSPTPLLAGILWCMSRIKSFRELLATGANECCALIDAMTSAAELGGKPRLGYQIRTMKPQ